MLIRNTQNYEISFNLVIGSFHIMNHIPVIHPSGQQSCLNLFHTNLSHPCSVKLNLPSMADYPCFKTMPGKQRDGKVSQNRHELLGFSRLAYLCRRNLSDINISIYSYAHNMYERFLGFVGKVFPTYAFDFDLPLPFEQAEEGVIFTELSARMSECCFLARVPQQPH